MKKGILGTSALVAVGAFAASPASADGIQLGLGGYMNTYFSVGGIDESNYTGWGSGDASYNATGLFSEGEIWFLGEYKHDNGIVFGARVELEATSTSNDIDKRFIYVSGDFGRIEAGSRQSAAYQMAYAAPYAGLPINSGWITVFVPGYDQGLISSFVSPGLSTYIDLGSGEENSISYYTPRFSGFQLGVTYIPTITGATPANFPVEANTETQYSNGISVGVNYVQDFNGFGLVVSGGYLFAQSPDDGPWDDYQGARGGVNFSYAGFTLGGSYAKVFEDAPVYLNTGADTLTDFAFTNQKGQSWDVGLTYGMGPWTVGVTYFRGTIEGYVWNNDDQRTQAVQGGVGYLLGPGITANAGIMYGKYELEDNASTGTHNQSGVVGAAGLTFNF